MKKESVFKYVIRLTLTLLLISATVAALLSVVNQITEPIIARTNAEKTQRAIEAVLPGGYDEEITDYTDSSGLISKVYKGKNGYALQATPVGFDGPITLMVGVDFSGKVLGISVVSHTESAGLGAIIASPNSAGEDFRNQFVGQLGPVLVCKDGGTIDAITNATITSRAICDGINAALNCAAGLS